MPDDPNIPINGGIVDADDGIPNGQAALPIFVGGLALAELPCMVGLFVFPAQKQNLFLPSFLGILQFVPFFARRYFPEADGDSRG